MSIKIVEFFLVFVTENVNIKTSTQSSEHFFEVLFVVHT